MEPNQAFSIEGESGGAGQRAVQGQASCGCRLVRHVRGSGAGHVSVHTHGDREGAVGNENGDLQGDI